MRCLTKFGLLVSLLTGFILFGPVPPTLGQKAKGEKVRFSTVDGVEIHGVFYANSKRPVVMLLHTLGEDSNKKGWTQLAEHLHSKGFAVVRFDFRGHGNSTDVDNTFWGPQFPINRGLVKGANRQTIEFKNFDSRYYPVLVNDIAAAKAFLERKNDTGECNVASLILIGADTGATLGALWLNSEWNRFRQPLNAFGQPFGPLETRPEGKDTICAIWLSISPKLGLGSRYVNVPGLFDNSGKEGATPMIFFVGDADKKGTNLAQVCVKRIKASTKVKDKYRYTDVVKIKGVKLTGINLIQSALKTDESISNYLKEVYEAKGNEYIERDFTKNYYVWRYPSTPKLIPAKLPNERMLLFNDYNMFLPR